MSNFYDCSRKKLQDLSIMEIEWLRQVLGCLPEDINVTWGVNDLRETYDTISGQLTERLMDVNSTHISELYGKCFISPSRCKIIHIIGPNKDNNDIINDILNEIDKKKNTPPPESACTDQAAGRCF